MYSWTKWGAQIPAAHHPIRRDKGVRVGDRGGGSHLTLLTTRVRRAHPRGAGDQPRRPERTRGDPPPATGQGTELRLRLLEGAQEAPVSAAGIITRLADADHRVWNVPDELLARMRWFILLFVVSRARASQTLHRRIARGSTRRPCRMGPRQHVEKGPQPAQVRRPALDERPSAPKRRVAIVTTAGLHRRVDRPFNGAAGMDYRVIPGDVRAGDLVMSHLSVKFDRSGFQRLERGFPPDDEELVG